MCDHHGDGPNVIQHASGAITAGCHHDSCSWTWQDQRAKIEPKRSRSRPATGSAQPKNDRPEAAAPDDFVLMNYFIEEIVNEAGETQKIIVPRSMNELLDEIACLTGQWPRRVDNVLSVDDHEHGLSYFDRRAATGLFGWLRRLTQVDWRTGPKLVSQSELFAELERSAAKYESIELLPHEPTIEGIYYRGDAPPPGDGRYLDQLLDRFRPETTIDRDLIKAAFMTPFWGGPAGARPAFVVTSDHGRGVGKTRLVETVSLLCGGAIDVSAGEEIEVVKTRMLTPAARTKRIATLDNIKTMKLSWAELEAMITAPTISGRQLYVGEGLRPNLLTWFLTLNGVSMATDMPQRSVIIKLVRGKNAGPWCEDTQRFIDAHRQSLIGDILGALRGERFQLAEYSRRATWEEHVLCRLPEPGEAQRVILERQGDANCELDEAEIIEEYFAKQLAQLGY